MGVKSCLQNVYVTITRKKTFASACNQTTELQRCLSTFDLTLIGIGSTLGSGIYVLTGEVAKNKAGPAIILSFFIAALASILSGLCYAEFSARIPKAGSAYVYCYVTMGELCAFIIGWNMLLEYIIGAAAIARGLTAYVDSLTGNYIQNKTIAITGPINVPGISPFIDFTSFGIVMAFTLLTSLGVKNSARLNNVCVLINILTVTLVVLVGLCFAKAENWDNFAPFGMQGVIAGASTCFFAFIGFDVIANVSEEAKNPKRSIPISMMTTISICFVAYFGVSGSITLMVNYRELSETAAVAVAFRQRGLLFMSYVIGGGATCGLLGTTLVSLMPTPRMLYSMSQDGLLFDCFSRVNERTHVPVISTVVSGVFIGLLAMLIDLGELVEMLSIGTLLAYSIVVLCVVILRYEVRPGILEAEEVDKKRCCSRSTAVKLVVTLTVVLLTSICIMLSKYSYKIAEEETAILLTFGLLGVTLVGTTVFLSRMHSNADEDIGFTVPLLPWLPVLALFFNIYLMLQLSVITWKRFFVWLAIGMVLYVLYGAKNSKERHFDIDTEEYTLIEPPKHSPTDESKQKYT